MRIAIIEMAVAVQIDESVEMRTLKLEPPLEFNVNVDVDVDPETPPDVSANLYYFANGVAYVVDSSAMVPRSRAEERAVVEVMPVTFRTAAATLWSFVVERAFSRKPRRAFYGKE